ncbi:hypothetical protein [Pararhodonellum marinum]|uniref:hypothetical protein n=1 Tax=Pararhodonellum marinum TaxID=2755358 RepID=UPI00188FB920|nr:hypothetical protein [Pararhodonellum marinum]
MNKHYLITLVILVFLTSITHAQNFYKEGLIRKHTISLHMGPSMIFADNSGDLSNFASKVQPAMAIAYGKRITPTVRLNATLGAQRVRSNEGNFSQEVHRNWGEEGQAYSFRGNAYTFDIVPTAYLFPYECQMFRKKFNLFAGLGLGVVHVDRKQSVFRDAGDLMEEVSTTAAYVPVRIGFTLPINGTFDVGMQGTLMYGLSDNLDGNIGHNRGNDHMAQVQLTVTHYISTYPFWRKWFFNL